MKNILIGQKSDSERPADIIQLFLPFETRIKLLSEEETSRQNIESNTALAIMTSYRENIMT